VFERLHAMQAGYWFGEQAHVSREHDVARHCAPVNHVVYGKGVGSLWPVVLPVTLVHAVNLLCAAMRASRLPTSEPIS